MSIDAHVHQWIAPEREGGPTVLALHGTGGDENDLVPLVRSLAPGAGILSPRGAVLEHGAPRFFRRLAEGVFDLPDLALRTETLADFIDAAARHYEFSLGSLYAVGYSNGANMAASLLLARPAVLAGGVLLRAMLPFEPKHPVELQGKKVLLSGGSRDRMIPRAGTLRLNEVLEQSGAEVRLIWQEAEHGLVGGDLDSAADFLGSL